MIRKRNSVSLPIIGIAFFILLAACARGESTPTPGMMKSITRTPSDTVSPLPTSTNIPTETAGQNLTTTPTFIPPDYVLKDWREPVEVITAENMDRVEQIGTLEFTGEIFHFEWSPNGTQIGVSVVPGGMFIMDSTSFAKEWLIDGDFAAFSYDGKILETGGQQYDLIKKERIVTMGLTLKYYPGQLLDVEFSPNGDYVVGAGTEFVHIYPMTSAIKDHIFWRSIPMHASVSPDSHIIAVNYELEDFTELWDPYQLRPIRLLKLKGITGVSKPRFTRDGKSLFFFGMGEWEGEKANFIQEWDYRTGRPLDVQILPGIGRAIGKTLDISPVSNVLAMGTEEGEVYIMPLRECRWIKMLGKSNFAISTISFRPDGKVIASFGKTDKRIKLWGIPSDKLNPAIETQSETPTVGPSACPKIPMVAEQPIPKSGWHVQ